MIIYLEKSAGNYHQTKEILKRFKNSPIVYIDNYKNIFDKSHKNINVLKSIVIAKLK
ncbi:MAG: hypothetical protein LBU14_01325 [Candidatus Peribacteria bacterium]|jgi:spore photoproduct lyase|nr:hypothetical protein [Candidatus Peribacteria bacterium]